MIFDFVPKVNELYKSPFGRVFLELFPRILARQVQVHNQERFGGFNQHTLDGIFVKSPWYILNSDSLHNKNDQDSLKKQTLEGIPSRSCTQLELIDCTTWFFVGWFWSVASARPQHPPVAWSVTGYFCWGNQVSPRQWLERAGFAVSWAWKLCFLFSFWWSAPRWRCFNIWKSLSNQLTLRHAPNKI